MRRALAAALLALTLGACSGTPPTSAPTIAPTVAATATPTPTPAPTEERQLVVGSFTLGGAERMDLDGDSCAGYPDRGYDDIAEGVRILVSNELDATIGTGALVFERFEGEQQSGVAVGACIFSFRVVNLPRASFYNFEIGDRGGLTYSYDEMVGMDWRVAFTLGD